ncbi:MAG: hypothetical protein IIA27_00925 [Gemmatimonadetes bacterium]|nr:hypothetical protein [Gemmatimonadota bacterium]
MSKFVSILLIALVGVGMATSQTAAQERSVTVDVRSVELLGDKDGAPSQLLLIGTNGVKHQLPDGRFTSESGAMIIVLDGLITSITAPRGRSVEVESMRVERGRVSLIGTNGVVGPPDGKYASRDGAMIIIENGSIKQLVLKEPNSGSSP